ncbi:hypothetical protein RJ641_003954 [Dillenia turbinata]|uniref:Uncharacterized protein n=1 Tax=Dillenia turbinata TaxID=194707 RepID=A0AAN8V945_9MAGN
MCDGFGTKSLILSGNIPGLFSESELNLQTWLSSSIIQHLGTNQKANSSESESEQNPHSKSSFVLRNNNIAKSNSSLASSGDNWIDR